MVFILDDKVGGFLKSLRSWGEEGFQTRSFGRESERIKKIGVDLSLRNGAGNFVA